MADSLIVEPPLPTNISHQNTADSKEGYGFCHAMYYAKSCSFLEKLCEVFRAELN